MLKKIYRLRSSTDIQNVLKQGKYLHIGDLLMVKWLESNRKYHRVTMVVSLKVSKKAVVRNRIRRVCMEAIEEKWLNENAGKHFDIVVVAKNVTPETVIEARDKLLIVLHSKIK